MRPRPQPSSRPQSPFVPSPQLQARVEEKKRQQQEAARRQQQAAASRREELARLRPTVRVLTPQEQEAKRAREAERQSRALEQKRLREEKSAQTDRVQKEIGKRMREQEGERLSILMGPEKEVPIATSRPITVAFARAQGHEQETKYDPGSGARIPVREPFNPLTARQLGPVRRPEPTEEEKRRARRTAVPLADRLEELKEKADDVAFRQLMDKLEAKQSLDDKQSAFWAKHRPQYLAYLQKSITDLEALPLEARTANWTEAIGNLQAQLNSVIEFELVGTPQGEDFFRRLEYQRRREDDLAAVARARAISANLPSDVRDTLRVPYSEAAAARAAIATVLAAVDEKAALDAAELERRRLLGATAATASGERDAEIQELIREEEKKRRERTTEIQELARLEEKSRRSAAAARRRTEPYARPDRTASGGGQLPRTASSGGGGGGDDAQVYMRSVRPIVPPPLPDYDRYPPRRRDR